MTSFRSTTVVRRSNGLSVLAGTSRWPRRRMGSGHSYRAGRRFDVGTASVDIVQRRQKRCDYCDSQNCGKDDGGSSLGLPKPTDYADRLDRFLQRGQFFEGIIDFSWAATRADIQVCSEWPEAVTCSAAAYPTSVSLLRVASPRLAHSIILLAMIRRALGFWLSVGRSKHARSRAISIFAIARESKVSVIIVLVTCKRPCSGTTLFGRIFGRRPGIYGHTQPGHFGKTMWLPEVKRFPIARLRRSSAP